MRRNMNGLPADSFDVADDQKDLLLRQEDTLLSRVGSLRLSQRIVKVAFNSFVSCLLTYVLPKKEEGGWKDLMVFLE